MNSPRKEFDSTQVVYFILRWWKHIAAIVFLAAIAAAIFSSPVFITPKFEARTTIFPTKTFSVSRTVILAWRDFMEFGEVEEAERLLQMLNSDNVRERVAQRFDLYSHYEIPLDTRFRETMLRQIYQGHFNFRRTQYGAIELRVRDKDPVKAAAMANELPALLDTVMNEIRQDRARIAYDVAKAAYQDMLTQMKKVEDSLRFVMRQGVYDPESQVMMLTRQLAMDLSQNNQPGTRVLENRLELLGEYGGTYLKLSRILEEMSPDLVEIQRRYREAKTDKEQFIPYSFILDRASVPEKKAYPVRWLIVFLSAFGTGFLGVMLLIVLESLKRKGIIGEKAIQGA